MKRARDIYILRFYYMMYGIMLKSQSIIRMLFVGSWLGFSSRNMLNHIDDRFYNADSNYCNTRYNQSGLFNWENQIIQKYFIDCKTIRVASAGGGRELYALHHLGFEVDGFECNHALARCANDMFLAEGLPIHVEYTNRDECPMSVREYDGFIIGWAAYTLIQGKSRRVAFLKQAYRQVADDGAIFLSFFCRPNASVYFRFVIMIANVFRTLLRREMCELGDNLSPNYVHHFTEDELRSELLDADFELIYYGNIGAGHAVALKRPR